MVYLIILITARITARFETTVCMRLAENCQLLTVNLDTDEHCGCVIRFTIRYFVIKIGHYFPWLIPVCLFFVCLSYVIDQLNTTTMILLACHTSVSLISPVCVVYLFVSVSLQFPIPFFPLYLCLSAAISLFLSHTHADISHTNLDKHFREDKHQNRMHKYYFRNRRLFESLLVNQCNSFPKLETPVTSTHQWHLYSLLSSTNHPWQWADDRLWRS